MITNMMSRCCKDLQHSTKFCPSWEAACVMDLYVCVDLCVDMRGGMCIDLCADMCA